MGNAASKAPKVSRKYPSSSHLMSPSTTPTQARTPFPPLTHSPHPTDVPANLKGLPAGLDPKLAARLQEIGPVSVHRPEARIPVKPDEMMTLLRNRTKMSQVLEEETRSEDGLRRHVPISIVKEIIRAKERGWDSSRISSEYKVDRSVVQKLDKHFAIPVEDVDGVGVWPQK